MKKKVCVAMMASVFAFLSFASVFADVEQPKTVEYPVPGKKNAKIKMKEIYKNEFWIEFYLVYEEANKTYDEKETEKAIYEFLSNYKRDNVYARVEIEDLKGTSIGKTITTMEKRVIFRHLRK